MRGPDARCLVCMVLWTSGCATRIESAVTIETRVGKYW